MSKLLQKMKDKLKFLYETIEYDMDSSKTLSNFLSRKFKENPVQFAETFFGEPELIKKWRETYTGRRVLPNPRKYDKDMETGKYGWQQNWKMDKDSDGNKVATRHGQPNVPYVKKELDPSRKQMAMQNIVGSDIKVKQGGKTVQARVLDQDKDGNKEGNDKGPGAVKVWAGSPKQDIMKTVSKKVQDGENTKDVQIGEPFKSTDFVTPNEGTNEFWVAKDDIVFDPVYQGFDQDQIPPEVVLRRLTMPDNKYENFKRYIITHAQDPDEGFYTFDDPNAVQGLDSPDKDRAKEAQKEKGKKEKEIVKEKEKIVRFLETMKTMTPSERVRYLFNIITFAKGLSKKQKDQTPGDRGQFKMAGKDTVAKQPGTPPRMSMQTGKTQTQHINLRPKKFKPGRGKV